MQANVLDGIEKISIFDVNYLDCSKSQYVSYLKWRGFPVEALYYNAFESTTEVYDQLVRRHKMRWQYDEQGFQDDDWPLIGMQKRDWRTDRFTCLEEQMQRLLERGTTVFLSVDVYYMPHRLPTYRRHHEPHSLLVSGYRAGGDKLLVFDEAAPLLLPYTFERECLEEAYDSAYSLHHMTWFEPVPDGPRVNRSEIAKRSEQWLAAFDDDWLLYDRIGDHLADAAGQADKLCLLAPWSAVFTLLNGSRAKYADYTLFMEAPERITELLRSCAAIADSIRNSLNKAQLTGKVPVGPVTEKCAMLKTHEMEVIDRLREMRWK